MRIAALEHFRRRAQNWDAIVGSMVAMLKADFQDPDTYAETMPAFATLVQDLSTRPEYRDAFPRMMQFWQEVQRHETVARTTFPVDWALGDGTKLAFNCVLSNWHDFDTCWAFDWQPADGDTAGWLQQRATVQLRAATAGPDYSDESDQEHAGGSGLPPLPPWHEVLRSAHKKSGFSQAALARAIGIAEETQFSYEHGRRKPSRPAVLKLARAMQLDGATANLVLTGADLTLVPSELARSLAGDASADPCFHPERWADRAQETRDRLLESIGEHPWPCWVLDAQCRLMTQNAEIG